MLYKTAYCIIYAKQDIARSDVFKHCLIDFKSVRQCLCLSIVLKFWIWQKSCYLAALLNEVQFKFQDNTNFHLYSANVESTNHFIPIEILSLFCITKITTNWEKVLTNYFLKALLNKLQWFGF